MFDLLVFYNIFCFLLSCLKHSWPSPFSQQSDKDLSIILMAGCYKISMSRHLFAWRPKATIASNSTEKERHTHREIEREREIQKKN